MKTLGFLFLSLISVSLFSHQETARFTVSSFTSNGRTFYNCDVVESKTEMLLEAMGATVKNVRCSGGIDPVNPRWTTDARVATTFETAHDGAVLDVELKGRDNCHLVKEIFEGLAKKFTVTQASKLSCGFRPHGSWSLSFSVVNN